MEITGLNFLLLLLSPIALLFVLILIIFLVLHPIMSKLYDRQYAASTAFKKQLKEIKAERKEIIENIKEGKRHYSIDELSGINQRHREIISSGPKEIYKAYLHDSGFYEFQEELGKDIKDIFN